MKIKSSHIFFILLLVTTTYSYGNTKEESMNKLIARVFKTAQKQCIKMDAQLNLYTLPQTTKRDGTLITSNNQWWCSGFFPGTLWYVYEYTKNSQIKNLAIKNTNKLDSIQYLKNSHDIGFQMYCSYGNALRLTNNKVYCKILHQSAVSLISRYNDKIKAIKSWDNKHWQYPVIIDNMMNLELLMAVAKIYNDTTFSHIACCHANTTMKNHFRKDYTCFHLVDYNSSTGFPIKKQTVQGFADNSAWARGQAWALYGYTMMYRMTKNNQYKLQAEHIADMLIKKIPVDGIPYWDFDSNRIPNDYRDASSAAIMASAFIELSQYTSNKIEQKSYINMAQKQIRTLASPTYLAKYGTNSFFILKHSVGNMPANSEIDVPLSYADYYFLEALLKYKKLILKDK